MTVIRTELEAAKPDRALGTGWLSGVLALVLAVAGLGTVLCLRYPEWLTMPEVRGYYNLPLVRLALHIGLIAAFVLGIVSITLRQQKALGFTALAVVLIATVLGGSRATDQIDVEADTYLGLDWFLLNLLFTGIVFIPIERLLGNREQPIFRYEWREDLLYFLLSSLMVQGLTFMSLAPALAILKHTEWGGCGRPWGARRWCCSFLRSCSSPTWCSTGCIGRSIVCRGCGSFTPCITRPRRWTGWPVRGCT